MSMKPHKLPNPRPTGINARAEPVTLAWIRSNCEEVPSVLGSPCWVWLGAQTRAGYGGVSFEGRTTYTHNVTCLLVGRPRPVNLNSEHLCRNRLCCRPEHVEFVSTRGSVKLPNPRPNSGTEPVTLAWIRSNCEIVPGELASLCWVWLGAQYKTGYGSVGFEGKGHRTHVVTCVLVGRVRPAGFDSDHLCRNRLCCRPKHIEFVTRRVNALRGLAHTFIDGKCPRCGLPGEYMRDIKGFEGRSLTCRPCNAKRVRDSRLRKRLCALAIV